MAGVLAGDPSPAQLCSKLSDMEPKTKLRGERTRERYIEREEPRREEKRARPRQSE